MSSKLVLRVRDLRKEFQSKRGPFVALDGISFSLKKGEILGLLGPNGAGKTTTIQILLSTLKPSSGEIVYFGKDFFKHRSEVLKHVMFASTYVSLPWKLTLQQNLDVFGRLYGLGGRELKQRIDEFLDKFGILDKKGTTVATLSAGQITRLVLVKAFMMRPKIVLLDEPTASLDPEMAKEVRELILSERDRRGTSILFTSHNMSEVTEVCDRTLFLRDGKIIVDDVPERLARSVSSSKLRLVVAERMKEVQSIAQRQKLPYEVDHHSIELKLDEKHIARFLMALATEGIEYSGIEIIEPTLEDYFLKMVQS